MLCLKSMIPVIMHLSKPIECSTPKVNHNISYGFGWLHCQCRLISCNRCSTLEGDVDNGRVYVWVESRWEISVPSQFWKERVLVVQSCLTLCNTMYCVHQTPLSMEFSRKKYWSIFVKNHLNKIFNPVIARQTTDSICCYL